MTAFLFVWLVAATLLEHILVVAPLDIKKPAKKVLYYVILAPVIALGYAKDILAKASIGATLTEWFKRVV